VASSRTGLGFRQAAKVPDIVAFQTIEENSFFVFNPIDKSYQLDRHPMSKDAITSLLTQ
jgi:hypothetical protein